LAEWLFEAGIGEDRAILTEDGAILEAQIERPALRAGTVADARLTSILIPGQRGIATLTDGSEVLIEPLPKVTEGAAIHVDIVRETIREPGALKRAKGRITDAVVCKGPDLATRIGAHRVVGPHEPDEFEAAGWSECLEQTASGIVAYPGGTLRIVLTPAMTLIDVDGDDALAGARAAGQAIRRFGISGNIGIDFPTVAGKAERQAIAAEVDAVMPQPFERTSVNGFGFLQIIRPRIRASLCEIVQFDPVGAAARMVLRRAQRSAIIGTCEIVAAPQVIAVIECNSNWVVQLSKHFGGIVSLRSDPAMPLSESHTHRIG
jgi:hypothetical protein